MKIKNRNAAVIIISLIALFVSGASLLWTLANQWEQNRRWESLNNGNPEVKEINMTKWKELTKEEAINTQWGYNPTIYGKGEIDNKFILPYRLVVRNASNEKIDRVNPVFTVHEVKQELIRIGYKGEASINMLFRPLFVIENMGMTVVKNLAIKIDAKLPDQEWQKAFTSNTTINLAGHQTSTIFFDFELPFDKQLPIQINFKIHFTFQDVNNKNVEKFINAKWTTNDNFWSYEPGNK